MADEPIRDIRLVIDNAPELNPPPTNRDPDDGDGKRGRGGGGPGSPDLPDNVPIVPLGKRGGACCFLDETRQYREEPQLTRHVISEAFGSRNGELFRDGFVRKNAEGNVMGIRPEVWADAIYRACGRLGLFDPHTRLRGRPY